MLDQRSPCKRIDDFDPKGQKAYMEKVLSSLEIPYDFMLSFDAERYKAIVFSDAEKWIDKIIRSFGMGKIAYARNLFGFRTREQLNLIKQSDLFFNMMDFLMNYFLIGNMDIHTQDINHKEIVSDASYEGEFLSLHFLDPNRTPNIIKFELSRMGSDGLFKLKDFTEEKIWNTSAFLLFGRPFFEKEDDFDEVVFAQLKKIIPTWMKEMKETKRVSA